MGALLCPAESRRKRITVMKKFKRAFVLSSLIPLLMNTAPFAFGDGADLPNDPGTIFANNLSIERPTAEQIKLLNARVTQAQSSAEINRQKAIETEAKLAGPGNCGNGVTQQTCLENEISDLQKGMGQLTEDALDERKAQIEEIQMQIDAPKDLQASAQQLSDFSAMLAEMIKNDDFSFRGQPLFLWKSLKVSWKYMIKPGELVAMAGGVGAYEVVDHTGISAVAKTEFNQPGAEWPSGVNEIGTLCGYGVCIVPFAVVGFLTHNAVTIRATDAMAVATAWNEVEGEIIKNGVQQPRPNPEPAGAFDPYGLPSLHAAETASIATITCRNFGKWLCAAGIVVAAFTDFTRVNQNLHSPPQILAGTFLGFINGVGADNATKYVDGVDNKPKSGIFRSAIVGDVKFRGNDFQFKPSFLPGGGIGPSVTITLVKK
jgi:hypothetical protein